MPSVETVLAQKAILGSILENVSPTPAGSVIGGRPDNEGADSVFSTVDWLEVCCEDLLTHPTSVRFLTREGLDYFLPAIAVSIRWGLDNNRPKSAVDLFDHTESSLNWLICDWAQRRNWATDKYLHLVDDINAAKLAI